MSQVTEGICGAISKCPQCEKMGILYEIEPAAIIPENITA